MKTKSLTTILLSILIALSFMPGYAFAEGESSDVNDQDLTEATEGAEAPETPETTEAPETPEAADVTQEDTANTTEDEASDVTKGDTGGTRGGAEIISSGKCGTNMTYTLDNAGLLTISGEGNMYELWLRPPWYSNKDTIKEVIIENGVTSIGNEAFSGCRSLTSITIPDSVTSIGYRAFSSCKSLTSITIPDGVTSIEWYAFYDCNSLTSITIPEGVTSIGDFAFWSCSLTSITIPDSVTSIGASAFSDCSDLTVITIPESVTSIGAGAFSDVSEGVVFYVVENSCAHSYVEEEGYSYIIIGVVYSIESIEDLNDVRNAPGDYILNCDLDLTDAVSSGGIYYNDGNGWDPIGTYDSPFKGSFDGNGHTIKGLYSRGTNECNGLFGYNNGTIKNLTIEDSDFEGTSYNIGTIAGSNNGIIDNCVSKASINVNVISCVGGLVGLNEKNIQKSSFSGRIEVNSQCASIGGIAGRNFYAIAEVSSEGEIVCDFNSSDYSYVGGIVGDDIGFTTVIDKANNNCAISCTAAGSGTIYTGGIAAKGSGVVAHSVNYQNISVNCTGTNTCYTGGITGRSDKVLDACVNKGEISAVGKDVYCGGIAGHCWSNSQVYYCGNQGKVSAKSKVTGGASVGGIIGDSGGTLDDLLGSDEDNRAQIMYCKNTGEIEDESTRIGGTSFHHCGGISGCCSYSDIWYCYNKGKVKTKNNYGMAGGIAGHSGYSSLIKECYNAGLVQGKNSETYSIIGGISGYNTDSTIINCYNTGAITGYNGNLGGVCGDSFDASVVLAYNAGPVIDKGNPTNTYRNGVVGIYMLSDRSKVNNLEQAIFTIDYAAPAALFYYTVNDRETVYGNVCNSEKMAESATFVNFDFSDVWTMGSGEYKYPILRDVLDSEDQNEMQDYMSSFNERIYGASRYDTAIKAADEYKAATGSKFENVIVAYGKNFPDALSGGYLAKVKNAPILLVEPKQEDRIADYISENIADGGKVYILGGTGAVSSAFESKVEAKGILTERLGGATRYETNLLILEEAGVTDQDILVCTGTGYADSLSASAVGKPILLVGKTLTDEQKTYIKSLSSDQFYLIGGTGAVSTSIETGLRRLGYSKIERLSGASRYETSTVVAKKFFPEAKTVVLAYAQNFPDGLSGGPLAMKKNAPIILTSSSKTVAAEKYVEETGAERSITLGGPSLISDIALIEIMGS